MFDHVTIRVGDRGREERVYATLLGTLGIERTAADAELAEWNDFSLMQADERNPPTTNLHLGFAAPSRAAVDEFWRAGLEAGYTDDGAPGPRPQYRADYYGGFLRDPDGNSVEAVHHGALPATASIDHIWVRVADLPAARAFYRALAPHAGLEPGTASAERVGFDLGASGLSLLEGPPTEGLHIAFAAGSDGAVDRFHQALVEAGYRDNGSPGERPYHRGYYAAFVFDPDDNNIELVNHNR